MYVDYSSLDPVYFFDSRPDIFTDDNSERVAVLETLIVENHQAEIPDIFFFPISHISGEVLDSEFGIGIDSVNVELYSEDDLDTPLSTTATDATGMYYFEEIPVGAYFIIFKIDEKLDFELTSELGDSTVVVNTGEENGQTLGYSHLIQTQIGEVLSNVNAVVKDKFPDALSIESQLHLSSRTNEEGISLNWSSTVDNTTLYTVYRSYADTKHFKPIYSCEGCTEYLDIPNQIGGYYYKITGSDAQGQIESNLTHSEMYGIEKLDIYPNPTPGLVTIVLNRSEQLKGLKVYDLDGKLLNELTPSSPQIDLSYLDNGIYFLSITTEQSHYVQQIVINH